MCSILPQDRFSRARRPWVLPSSSMTDAQWSVIEPLLPADSVLSITVPIVNHTEDLSGFRG